MTHNILRAVDLRDRTKLIVSGKVLTGFSVVKMLAMGADVCNAARAMMFALGCIQVHGLLRDHTVRTDRDMVFAINCAPG